MYSCKVVVALKEAFDSIGELLNVLASSNVGTQCSEFGRVLNNKGICIPAKVLRP